ncbi:STAG-domain-containing protein [Lentithecium fluviatile CBS 122367]|uniref:STAG-domain-containing protein n=1 Tax=Lentithecium fluviatile CBS 122367 TaxID=1168545 RepID=A0A6G1IK83_9PLEO|nr:STAG-domain-containing protein [Lentithecium fluviatile CBS 122367]
MSAAVAPSSAADTTSSATRRRSGRVTKRPEKFAPESSPALSAKRKRRDGNESDIDSDAPLSDDEQSESSQGEPDEEEVRARRRKKKSGPGAKKPPQKKPKTNGEVVNLAIRPAKPAKRKNAKPRKALARKSALVDEDADGLYAEIYARGSRLEDVAAQWIGRFNEHEANAVAELINFVIRAAGCHIQIDEDDIADPDNCVHRLGEIQDDYQHEEISGYPLISKRGAGPFRNSLQGFFIILVQTIARSGLMYEDNQLMENIQVWICTMSSATNRPFRHTSTVVALGVTTGLAQVASDIAENAAKMLRQKETEAKKSRANKSRLSTIDKEVAVLNQKLEHVKSLITDWFDTVYVHRYRDVDPKVRAECCEALADWIMTYPDMFFDSNHLRYLGWILSDTHEGTRAEVLKQLSRLFKDKDKLAGLKTFTERFRPRIVEIATRDSHTNLRASAVELLDVLREAGFLEPDDIDTVGKLIFDSEPRVRKAVVGFFAENVNAAYDLLVEDMGGQEALDEALAPLDDDEEYENPRLEWLKMKCLVQQLLSYDEDTGLPSQIERITPYGAELGLVSVGIESRFSLAAQALYDALPEVRSWEVLAGYLLYDHSQTVADAAGEDVETMLRQNCKLEENEETALLDILNAAVRTRLQRSAEAQKDKKRTKAQREAQKAEQEETARRLTILIPQLLKKFGALPEAAALCLRLERELNLDVFQELRQDTALTALLDDINKQFLTHHNEHVLNEAIGSILHASGNDELKELVSLKIRALWDDLTGTFDALRRGRDLSVCGNMDQNILSGVSNIVLKMAELAKASDPSTLDLIAPPTKSRSRSQRHAALDTPPIASLLQILDRGVPGADSDPETDEAEDVLVRHTMSLMLMYFLWKCRHLSTHIEAGARIPDDDLDQVAGRRDACVTALMRILESRKGADEVRVEAANLLLDIYNMFRSLKVMKAKVNKGSKKSNGRAGEEANDDWEALCQDVDQPTVKLLLQILTALENNLAKRVRKRLEEPDVDDDPIDPDDEPESSDDEAEDEQSQSHQQIRTLLAEERLCTFGSRVVQGVQAGTLDNDDSSVRKRLERNRTKLTPTWREVVGHLDLNKAIKGKGGKKTQPIKEAAKPAKSKKIVIEDDSEEEEQMDEDEEMGDAEEQVNGDASATEENGAAEQSPGAESVLGD